MAGPSPTRQDPTVPAQAPTQPQEPDYQKDYWAQDRPQVLASKGLQDTSGKVWNGTAWAAPPPTAPANQPGQSGPWNGAGVPAGFDANKWNDPTKNDPKYDVGHMVASGWGNDQIGQWMQSHPDEFKGYNISGKDTITDAQGNIFDFRHGMNEDPNHQGTAQWTAVGGPGGSHSITAGLGIPNGGISGFGNYGGVPGDIMASLLGGGNGQSSSYSAILSAMGGLPPTAPGDLYSQLQGRSNQSLNVNAQDPVIAAQVNAYRAEQQRGANNYIDQQAEAGGPYANLNSERRLANEHAAQATGQMQAGVMQNELTARRQEIQNALSEMGNMLSDQQKIALQRELGLIDANLKQQGITNQNNQFLDQFGLDATDKANYWDAIRSGLLNG